MYTAASGGVFGKCLEECLEDTRGPVHDTAGHRGGRDDGKSL